jgi:tetratricopeptide (TPR) repeat protein
VQLDLSIDLSNVAYGHLTRRQYPDAIAVYSQSLAMREKLADSDPKDHLARSKVAFVHHQLGFLFEVTGDKARAMDEYRRAISDYETTGLSLADEKSFNANSWAGVAGLEAAAGRQAESCKAWQQAFDLFATLSQEDRRSHLDVRDDPLLRVSQRAAACGSRAAAEWSKTNSTPPATR